MFLTLIDPSQIIDVLTRTGHLYQLCQIRYTWRRNKWVCTFCTYEIPKYLYPPYLDYFSKHFRIDIFLCLNVQKISNFRSDVQNQYSVSHVTPLCGTDMYNGVMMTQEEVLCPRRYCRIRRMRPLINPPKEVKNRKVQIFIPTITFLDKNKTLDMKNKNGLTILKWGLQLNFFPKILKCCLKNYNFLDFSRKKCVWMGARPNVTS